MRLAARRCNERGGGGEHVRRGYERIPSRVGQCLRRTGPEPRGVLILNEKKIIRKSLVTPLKLGFVTFVVLCFHTSKSTSGAQNNTVKSSVADPDPFHFRLPDPTPA